MSPIITLIVLAAAVMHASWNALIKAGNDKVVMQCLVMFFAGLPCLPVLAFVPLPAPASRPFLALSLAVHGVYYVTLINAYRFGALSQVYPIARGAAPLMIALGAWAFAGEAMSPLEWAGVIVASAGIMSLAAPGKLPREEELKAIGFAPPGLSCRRRPASIITGPWLWAPAFAGATTRKVGWIRYCKRNTSPAWRCH